MNSVGFGWAVQSEAWRRAAMIMVTSLAALVIIPCFARDLPAVAAGRGETDSYEVATTINLGGSPRDIVVDAARERAYVLDAKNGVVSVIDADSFSVIRIWSVGSAVTTIALDGARRVLLAAEYTNDRTQILYIDAATGQRVGAVEVGMRVNALVVDPMTSTAFAGGEGTYQQSPIDARIASIRLLGDPVVNLQKLGVTLDRVINLAVDPARRRLYAMQIGRYLSSRLVVLDSDDLKEISDVSFTNPSGAPGLALDRTHRRALVAMGWDALSVVDLAVEMNLVDPASIVTRVPFDAPDSIAVDETAKTAYVSSWSDTSVHEVVVLETVGFAVLAKVPVGNGRHRLSVDEAKHLAYVTNEIDGTVTVIRRTTSPEP